MRKATTRAHLLVAAAALLLATCSGGKDETGGTSASPHVPDVAAPVPAITADPELARRDLSFSAHDPDRDGRVTPSEYAAGSQRFFAAVDAGDDGTLSLDELEAARAAMRIADQSLSAKTIARADNDGDGELTLAEYIGFVNQRFTGSDTDGDRQLTPSEFAEGFAEVPGAAGTPPPAGASAGITAAK